jgi:putative protein-disulfide isomerase
MNLLYIADPLCSWCYGFGPELAMFAARHPGARIDLVMGGLRPYNREPMSVAFRTMLMEHWNHVAQASGLPFSRTAIDRPGFVFVAARTIDESGALGYLSAVQAAFYRDGRDATDDRVLADIAAENGYERRSFAAAIESGPMREAARDDFARSQSMGVGGFPTVALLRGGELYLVTSGYATDDVLEYRIGEIERRVAPITAGPA